MNSIDIDKVVEHVKIIVDNTRCTTCDKLDGYRYRYTCGHSICDSCVVSAEECQICCLTILPQAPHRIDNVLTQRVKNASTLLKECESLFHTDVNQRRRISEQLKIEKELFPKCIQAPVKYENKRKSAQYSFSKKNKENQKPSVFPGEQIASLIDMKMERSKVKYVQQWLTKNDKDFTRKALGDINVNTPLRNKTTNFKDLKTCKVINLRKDHDENVLNTNKKRKHFKVTNDQYLVKLDSFSKGDAEVKKFKKDSVNLTAKKNDNDESGIFMDNDPIVIDDSQETYIDKDHEAWIAVLNANENESEPTLINYLNCSNPPNCTNKASTSNVPLNKDSVSARVPFYKRSIIVETCQKCNYDIPEQSKNKDVNVTIEGTDYFTTINIVRNVEDKERSLNSVLVQTDISEVVVSKDNNSVEDFYINDNKINTQIIAAVSNTRSEDLFLDEIKNNKESIMNVVIEETDSETDIETSGPVNVKVDVHKSCDPIDYGILSEVGNLEEHHARSRRPPRGHTPTSTDSSDKENFNPNRIKKHICKKKHTKTKLY